MRLLFSILSLCLLKNRFVAAFDKEDFLVTGLGDVEPAFNSFNGDMYAGRLPIDVAPAEKRGELMFWLFQSNKNHDSITIWLNGGPGCTAFSAGLLFELSPVTTPHFPAGYPKTEYIEPLIPNEWGWTEATDLLFVEQPAGTGFSKGPMPQTEADLSKDFYNFLINFYETFPEMKSKKLFVTGESYAGMYVPSIAHQIHLENQKKEKKMHIDLTGIAIGDPWMGSKVQADSVIEFAYWHGMIDSTARLAFHEKLKDCLAGVRMRPPFQDFTIPGECGIATNVLAAAGAGIFPDMSPNVYDVTTWDRYPVINDDNNTIVQFYNNPKVKELLHAPDDDTYWLGCIPGAGRRLEKQNDVGLLPGEILLAHDKPESTVPYIAEMLDNGIRVLIYVGDRDLSCNAQGAEKLLDDMEWSGANDWKTARRHLWMVNNQVAGYSKSTGDFDFVIVYNSGHLVPHNVPVQALDLIKRFVNDESFSDVELPYYEPQRRPYSQAEMAKWPAFHAALILAVALVCFLCGYLVAIHFGRKGYTRISDSNGNGYN